MTDVEILESWGVNVLTSNEFYTPDLSVTALLEIMQQVRSDAAMQGVKVWISADEWKFDDVNQADIWFVEPPTMHDGIYDATGGYGIKYEIAGKLGLKFGECKPFLITEVQDAE